MKMVARLLLALLLALVPASSAQGEDSPSIYETLSRALERQPALSSMAGILYPREPLLEHTEPERRGFTSAELQYMRKIFKTDPLQQQTPFGQLLQGRQLPNLQPMQDLSLGSALQRVREDPYRAAEILQRLVEAKTSREQRQEGRTMADHKSTNMTEEELFEECKTDYDAFVKPITDGLGFTVCEAICTGPIICGLCGIAFPQHDEDVPEWGGRMIDAMSKIPEGIMEGRLHWQGAYEYCEEYEVTYNFTHSPLVTRQFDGRYCRLELTPPPDENSTLGLDLSLLFGVCVPSTCKPHHVERYIAEDNLVLSYVLGEMLDMNITDVYCGRELDSSSDPRFQAAVAIIGILAGLVIIASIWDGCPCIRKRWISDKVKNLPRVVTAPGIDTFSKDDKLKAETNGHYLTTLEVEQIVDLVEGIPGPSSQQATKDRKVSIPRGSKVAPLQEGVSREPSAPPGESYNSQPSALSTGSLLQDVQEAQEELKIGLWQRLEMVLTGFSAYSNATRIFRCSGGDNEIPVLNGIRVMSFGWILVGHTWLFGPVYFECWVPSNLLGAVLRFPKQWNFQPILNFTFNSDSFLVISGILVTYWWLRRFENSKNRLSCGMVAHHIIHKYWRMMPATMLAMMFYTCLYRYLGDGPFYPRFVQDAENCRTNWWPNLLMVNNFVNTHKTCLTWMWYPPLLFQLHVFSLIVLVPLALKPVAGYMMLAAMFIAHIGATAGITTRIYDDDDDFSWYWDYLVTPWCRAGAYVIGMATGVVLHRLRGSKIKMHWTVAVAGWVVALAAIFLVVFITHEQYKEDGEQWSQSKDAAYDTLSRNAWALGLAWIVFSCHMGYGGVINSLLSYKFWWPLSKLVFVAYTTHSMIIFALAYGRMTPLYINEYQQSYRVFGHFWMNMLLGFVWALLWQYPLSVGLERAVLCQDKLGWIRAGRHPRKEVEDIEREYSLLRQEKAAGVVNGTWEPTKEAQAQMQGEVNRGFEGQAVEEKTGEKQEHKEHINREDSVTPV